MPRPALRPGLLACSPWQLCSCAARGIWHSPAPQSPILVAAQILLCGCKSSTIALIYNFCLAMQNTSAAVGGAGEAQAQEQCLAWHRWLWLWRWRWRRMCWLSIQIFCCLFALVRINDRQKGGGGAVDEGWREKLKREAGWLCSGNVMSTLTRELPNRHAHARLSTISPSPPSSSSPPPPLLLSCIILAVACCISLAIMSLGSALMHNLPACQATARATAAAERKGRGGERREERFTDGRYVSRFDFVS